MPSSESTESRLARLEERVRTMESDIASIRPRLHMLTNAVNPMPIMFSDVERHEQHIQELRSMFRAAKWLVIIAAPILALVTAATPFIVRATIKDVMSHQP